MPITPPSASSTGLSGGGCARSCASRKSAQGRVSVAPTINDGQMPSSRKPGVRASHGLVIGETVSMKKPPTGEPYAGCERKAGMSLPVKVWSVQSRAGGTGASLAGVAATRGPKRRQRLDGVGRGVELTPEIGMWRRQSWRPHQRKQHIGSRHARDRMLRRGLGPRHGQKAHSGTYETHQRPPTVYGGGGERGTTIVRRIADGSRTAPYYR